MVMTTAMSTAPNAITSAHWPSRVYNQPAHRRTCSATSCGRRPSLSTR
jgi:hypothetical protein